MLKLNNEQQLALGTYLRSERQWKRSSRIGRARLHLKNAWAREDQGDIAFFRAVIRMNDFDEMDKRWDEAQLWRNV